MVRFATPIVATDFMGYIFEVSKFHKVAASVNLFGELKLFSSNPKIPVLKRKKYIKMLRKLYKLKFLKLNDDPFWDVRDSINLPLDYTKAIFIEEPIFHSEST